APLCSSLFPYTTLFRSLVLVLALELEVASYMTLNDVGRNATVVPEELVGQSGTGKVGFRLGKDRLLGSSVHGYGQRAARERDLRSEEHTSELQSLTNLV